jgi:hypothetical protein
MGNSMANSDTNGGNSLFNMGAATMGRIDSLIRKISDFKSILYMNGIPMDSMIQRLQRELYTELYPYLNDEEVKDANDKFLSVFKKYPIINTGTSLLVPQVTEDAMEDFQLWTMRKLKDKGLLTPLSEDIAANPWGLK